ncbi:hypothetical protein MBLNU459_g6851t2 [Dothideomycetes sp. NU459]
MDAFSKPDAIRSTSVEYTSDAANTFRGPSSKPASAKKAEVGFGAPEYLIDGSESVSIQIAHDTTHRRLKPRHIQLIGIGGTIGTALYVSIGNGLIHGGPGSLFLAFTIW